MGRLGHLQREILGCVPGIGGLVVFVCVFLLGGGGALLSWKAQTSTHTHTHIHTKTILESPRMIPGNSHAKSLVYFFSP